MRVEHKWRAADVIKLCDLNVKKVEGGEVLVGSGVFDFMVIRDSETGKYILCFDASGFKHLSYLKFVFMLTRCGKMRFNKVSR